MKKLIVSLAIGVTAIAQAGLFDIKINTRGNESNKRSKRSSWQLVDRQAFEEKAEAERKAAEDERKAAEEKVAAERKLAEEKAEAELKAAEAERRAAAEKAASQSAEEERLALSRYADGTEMPACVLEVARYMRDTFSATIEEASKSSSRYYDFREKTCLNPWSSWEAGMRKLSLEDVFKYDVLGATWENPPIKEGYGEKRFIVGGKWYQGSWWGGSGTWFSVRQNGELESDCAKMLSKMKDVVRRLNVAQKTFEAKSEEYAKRFDELHEGFKLNPFKSIHFGDTPYGVYTNLKALVKDNYKGDLYSFDQQRFLSRIIPQLPWREMCGLALQNNTLEMGFSRYTEDDAPGLTYLKLSFANLIPSVDALKKKYEGLGFVLKSENECIGSIWLDQEKVDSQVLRKYENAMTTLTGAALGGVLATEVDRAKKTLVEIQAKHMKPVYRETVSGTYKGYNLEIRTKGLKIRDGVVEGEGNPGDVESLVLWDQATIEAQQTEFVNFQKAAAESAARAAAEEAEKNKAAALDF